MTQAGSTAGDRPGTGDASGGADAAVYVSCAESGELHVLRLGARSGALAPVQCLAHGGALMPMALSPDGRFLYVARRSAPLEVLSHAIDPTTGELTLLGAAPLPDSMASIATDRSGRLLFGASYGGGVIAVGPIDASGLAGPATQVIAIGAKAHAIEADPSNRRVLATSLGDGVVCAFELDTANGRLAEAAVAARVTPHPGASPRHLAYARDGRFVYLLGELDAAIDVMAFDADTGAMRTLQTVYAMPPGADGEPWAADLHLTPDGRFLYASERRSGTVAGFRVDPARGTLEAIGHTPVESQPRGFAIALDGRHLVVAGQASDHVGVHAVDTSTGALEARTRVACGRGPNWVVCRALNGAG